MYIQNREQCLQHINFAYALVDISLVAIDHPNNSIDCNSLEHCLSQCLSHLKAVRDEIMRSADSEIILSIPESV